MQYISPISVQFIWHPDDSKIVEPIIAYCKKNLSRDIDHPFLRTLDFPVFCYTSYNSENVPSKINTMAAKTIVFVFIGDSIVASDEWDNYFHNQLHNNVKIIPIALSNNAFKLSFVKPINSLRYSEYADKYKDKDLDQAFFIAIAHEIYRWLLNGDKNCRLKLFLSHTKKDKTGLELALDLKRFIDSDTTMDNFFDTNDIQVGNEFDNEILKNIQESTLIIIQSDTYSSRYWCQKEIIYAKKNRCPIITVDYIKSYEDRSFPLMCNFPSIRYNNNILDILELALLETIRFHYSDALFAEHKCCGNIPDNAITFNCVPDSFAVKRANSDTIVYPEPELYQDEIELLSNGKKLITPLAYNSSALAETKVGLSISEISDNELIILGQDKSHLKKLSQMLAQKMIRNGAQLIYGGDLRNDGFTEFLFEEAAIIQDKIQSSEILIKNYTMWPIHLLQNEDFINWSASYKGICKFEKMSPAPDVENELDSTKPITRDTAQNRYIWSRCLTYMREEMITECDFRISAGGKVTQYTGCMPGILEEIYIAINRNKPLYLLGGFGGVTSKLCHYLQTGVILEELSVDWQKTNNEHYSELLLEYTKHNKKIDYSWFSKLTINSLNNGLSEDDNLRLFNTPFVDEAIHLITKGVKNLRSF